MFICPYEQRIHVTSNFAAAQELTNKLGAVAAIDALVGTASTQAEATKQNFSDHLSVQLSSSTDYNLLEKVRLAGGLLATARA